MAAMLRPFACAAILALLGACQQTEPVTARLTNSCGPLDESAFEILVPVKGGTVKLLGEGSAGSAQGRYELANERFTPFRQILWCETQGTCHRAQSGYFEVTAQAGGGVTGRFEAASVETGQYAAHFVTGPAEPLRGFCG